MNGKGEDIFARTRSLLGTAVLAALARARVAIVGVGGVGGWTAETLVRSGVGHVLLVDDDVVAPSNVNRQITADARTTGRPKVSVLAARLATVNPACRIDARVMRYTVETAGELDLGSYDFIVDAIDSLACKAALIRQATALEGVAFFSSMGAGRRLDLSRIHAGRFSKVTGDGLARALRQRFKKEASFPKRDFICVWSDEPPRSPQGQAPAPALGSYMPVTAAFGLHLADLVVKRVMSVAICCSQCPAGQARTTDPVDQTISIPP